MEDIFDILSEVTGITKYSNSEVPTPAWVVKDMVDLLPADVFAPESKFLDPAVKSGRFLTEIYRRLMDSDAMKQAFPDRQARRKHILDNQLYGFATSSVATTITRKALYDDPTIAGNIVYVDRYLVKMANKTIDFKKLMQGEFGENMKFDVVIGNPPYQEDTGGKQSKPLYHRFVEQVLQLNPKYTSFIIPSRWLNGGVGLDNFRNTMLDNVHIKYLKDFANAEEVFQNVLISGGVMYFLIDSSYTGKCTVEYVTDGASSISQRYLNQYDTYIRDNKAVAILDKILSSGDRSIEHLMSSLNPFGIDADTRGCPCETKDYKYKLLSSGGTGYVTYDDIIKGYEYIPNYKVIVAKALSSKKGKVLATISTLVPNQVCTFSYFIAGTFDNPTVANNMEHYLKTKFARFGVLQTAVSINISKKNFCFVPLLDFSHPWTDQMLYDRYGLTQEERDYIEATIKPME